MKKRKKSKQRIGFMTLFLILSLATGCGDSRHAENTGIAERASLKTGSLNYGYFFEEEGIVLSSPDRFLYSDWEPMEFDYICTDPTCSHLTGNCSTHTIQDEASVLKDFSLLYQDRLIILHAYSQYVPSESSETVWDYSIVYQMDVYEADSDGNNRRRKATFSGAIDDPVIPYAAVLADGKLYFAGITEVRNRIELDIPGGGQTIETWVSDAIYCLDLNDYALETLVVADNKEGEPIYSYQFYEYDGMIYGIIDSSQDAVWYRIDPSVGDCAEILHFDSDAARFCAAIGDTVYYTYEDSGKTLYARDVEAVTKEREIMTVTGESMRVSTFILDGQLLIMTERCMEGEDRMTEYTVFDPEGNVLDKIRYDDYITFLDVIGDKIIYFRGYPDWEIWWADKEDIRDLSEKGVKIGPLNGGRLDTLEN